MDVISKEHHIIKRCVICDSEMKRRMKHTGADAGVHFWVCAKYPECRNVEKCETPKKNKPNLTQVTTGNRPKKSNNMDQEERSYSKVALFFGTAVIFAFVVAGTLNVNLTKMIFGEIGTRTTETGLTNEAREQPRPIQPVPAKILDQRQPEDSHAGAIYTFTDGNGILTMVSDKEKVPIRYRANMKVSSASGSNSKTTAVTVRDNRIYVPVTIGYRGKMVTVSLLIDTGATGVMISPAIAQRLGIRLEETTQGVTTVADGRKIANFNAVTDFVAVGPKTKRALQVNILPHESNEETGLLGMSFLADFPHMLDTKAQVIKWM
ncbi:MAG: retropepsin-like aspartic protease [Desulfuromonadaceae bacterium]|nr:retropepsin-like aspartic protease [Desulfuromonadaceae bacterium]